MITDGLNLKIEWFFGCLLLTLDGLNQLLFTTNLSNSFGKSPLKQVNDWLNQFGISNIKEMNLYSDTKNNHGFDKSMPICAGQTLPSASVLW